MKSLYLVVSIFAFFLIGIMLFSFYQARAKLDKIIVENKMLIEQKRKLDNNIRISSQINANNDVYLVDDLLVGDTIVDHLLNKEEDILILWVSEMHCMPCVESIYKIVEDFAKRRKIKVAILATFESPRSFEFLKMELPNDIMIVNNRKGYYNHQAFNISMPVIFIKHNRQLKHFLVADKNLPDIITLYLDNICKKYFTQVINQIII